MFLRPFLKNNRSPNVGRILQALGSIHKPCGQHGRGEGGLSDIHISI